MRTTTFLFLSGVEPFEDEARQRKEASTLSKIMWKWDEEDFKRMQSLFRKALEATMQDSNDRGQGRI